MAIKIAINGFGRMGRLAARALWGHPEVELVHVNEIGGDAACAAHLLYFDSVHGRWDRECSGEGAQMVVDGKKISFTISFGERKINYTGELMSDNELVIKNERGETKLTRVK